MAANENPISDLPAAANAALPSSIAPSDGTGQPRPVMERNVTVEAVEAAQDLAAGGKKESFVALSPILLSGKKLTIGQRIQLTLKEATELLQAAAVRLWTEADEIEQKLAAELAAKLKG